MALCPWCRKTDLPIHILKQHIKFCIDSPRPRGLLRKKRSEKETEIEKLLRQ
jgi:hypothetical protein